VSTLFRQKYVIDNGVRRSVAAREIGLPSILATIYGGGGKVTRSISLDDLFAPSDKTEISRDNRFERVYEGTKLNADLIPAIEVHVYDSRNDTYLIPISQVALV
jgi:hypothetical protein